MRVDSSIGPTELWYEVSEPGSDLVDDSADAALVGLLLPAMLAGEDVHVDGEVSSEILDSARGPAQAVLALLQPLASRIEVTAPATTLQRTPVADGVATGFSGGVDSYCVLADHFYGKVSPGLRISHLLFNNVGSHGVGGERLFRRRFDRLREAAAAISLPFVAVNSNLAEFYRGIPFEQSHTVRNASVGHLLSAGIGRLIYASAYGYSDIAIKRGRGMGCADPILLPLLSTRRLALIASGSEHTRVAKTQRVAEIPESYASLDVCGSGRHVGPKINCSRCWKCARTMLTLEIAGVLDRYSDVFDLNAYRSIRTRHCARVLRSQDPLLVEIASFARGEGFDFPIISKVGSIPGVNGVFHCLSALKRVLLSSDATC